ncbi:TRAP transporter large permease [Orrella sp. 11846]|uniref:TRAP transporter large permease n=1 Tax=Orrella sp. 11846 TaxID=3409913 RepID=UPI003B5B9249
MSTEILTLLFFGSLILFLVLGLPLAFVLGGVSTLFLMFTWGPQSFFMVAAKVWSTMESFTLVAIPLFVFMAMVLERTGVARALYHMMYLWWGGVRGGLAIGTVFICAIFAAMVGISGAAVVAMGTIALPTMLERGYNKRMVLGCINMGGGLGILIPPSVLMILYSLVTGVSVGQMFAAGVLPGILLVGLVSLYILIRCLIQPEMAPALPKEERATWAEKIRALRAVILPALIVLMVLGSIAAGAATPTEAAAIGVLGALISAIVHKQFSWKFMREASVKTFALTGMIMWILFAAHAFSAAYQSMGAQSMIQDLMMSIPGGKWAILIVMQAILFLLGMVLDPVGIMLITLPVFMPMIMEMGFNPVWFGILFVMNMELGYMTPPFGFNLFYLKGVVPASVSMRDIYISVIPYVLVGILGIAIIMMFPEIALWLPKLLFSR